MQPDTLALGTHRPPTIQYKVWDLLFRIESRILPVLLQIRSYIRRGGSSAPVLLTYPEKPLFFHTLTMLAAYMGARITDDPSADAQVVIHFQDITVRPEEPVLEERRSQGVTIINASCRDISKSRVEEVFESIFGYGMKIDPTTHAGKCVRKSNGNANHDGLVIDCPSPRQEGYIYQKLVNNQKGQWATDIRVPVIGGEIPIVWEKFKHITDRFDNMRFSTIHEPKELLSEEELLKIRTFATTFGLDYGEIDVIRDQEDGKIYLIDVNNTPGAIHPFEHVTLGEYLRINRLMARAFKNAFFKENSILVADTYS